MVFVVLGYTKCLSSGITENKDKVVYREEKSMQFSPTIKLTRKNPVDK